MRRLFTTALCTFGLLGTLNATLVETAGAREVQSAQDCVGLHSSDAGDGLTFELQNDCDRRLTCRVTWNLKCGDKPAKQTERGLARFEIPVDESHAVTATMDACGNRSWRIDDVQWSCSGK